MIISLFLITVTLCLSKVTIHSSSHNCPIDMIMEWRLGIISACFAWLDNCFSGICAWCVDSIVDELGSFTLIGFYDGSLVWNIDVRASRQCPVHPELAIGSFVWGCGGDVYRKCAVIIIYVGLVLPPEVILLH